MVVCVDDFIPQHLANTIWALAMLVNNSEQSNSRHVVDQNVLDRLLHQLENAAQSGTLVEESYQQIFQAHHLLGDRFKPSAALLEQSRDAWSKQLARSSSSSRSSLEKEVAACLDRLGIAYDVEVLTENGMHRVDMLVRGSTDDGDGGGGGGGEKLLAIECDGPMHFMRTSGGTYRIDGSTHARNRALRKLGFDVLCISLHKWDGMKKDERDGYLSRELRERGIVV